MGQLQTAQFPHIKKTKNRKQNNRVERQPVEWEKIITSHVSDKGVNI